MRKIFILGPQGSGKGTQATLLSAKLSIPHLSMGDLLRAEIASGSELSKEIPAMETGELTPDTLVLRILKKRLEGEDTKEGYILDGYPRNEAQYQVYNDFDTPTDVIVLNIPREDSVKRLLKRAEIEKRMDDTPDAIDRRLAIYESETQPMLKHFRDAGLVRDVDGMGSVDEIAERIALALELTND